MLLARPCAARPVPTPSTAVVGKALPPDGCCWHGHAPLGRYPRPPRLMLARPRAGADAPMAAVGKALRRRGLAQRLLLARPYAARPPTVDVGTATGWCARPNGCCWHGPAPLGRCPRPQRLLLAGPCPPTAAVGTALRRRGLVQWLLLARPCAAEGWCNGCCWHGPAPPRAGATAAVGTAMCR
jgi:hypothetical protein